MKTCNIYGSANVKLIDGELPENYNSMTLVEQANVLSNLAAQWMQENCQGVPSNFDSLGKFMKDFGIGHDWKESGFETPTEEEIKAFDEMPKAPELNVEEMQECLIPGLVYTEIKKDGTKEWHKYKQLEYIILVILNTSNDIKKYFAQTDSIIFILIILYIKNQYEEDIRQNIILLVYVGLNRRQGHELMKIQSKDSEYYKFCYMVIRKFLIFEL